MRLAADREPDPSLPGEACYSELQVWQGLCPRKVIQKVDCCCTHENTPQGTQGVGILTLMHTELPGPSFPVTSMKDLDAPNLLSQGYLPKISLGVSATPKSISLESEVLT